MPHDSNSTPAPGAVSLFSSDEFRLEITPHDADGFRVTAPPLARQLGYRDAADMLRTVPAGEKGYELVRTPGGEQRAGYLTEKGFYRVLGQRQAARVTDPEAREFVTRFQDWVYGEVLPKLRRGELTLSAPTVDLAELSDREKLLALAAGLLDAEKRTAEAIDRASVSEAALESAAPAIEYMDRYVVEDDVSTVKKWAAQFGLTERQARDLLVEKKVIYRERVGWRYSDTKQAMVEEYEYRARAGRVTFDWFDLRPQHNAPRIHNGQVRHTLYVRQARALELGRKVGLTQPQIPGTEIATVERSDDAA